MIERYWLTKSREQMTDEEWEALCDGCGRCCLHKIEDEDTGQIYFTSVACRLLDLSRCRCTRYSERHELVPDCLSLKSASFDRYDWLPSTCAYRLLAEGKDLPKWHPLLTGTSASLAIAEIKITDWAVSEAEMQGDLQDYVLPDEL